MRGRGFTLIELMIALGLMFVGLLGLLSLEIVSMQASNRARNLTEALVLAQDKLETLRHLPIASVASATETSLGPQGAVVAKGIYTRTTTVAALATTAGALSIRVVVSWPDYKPGKTHSVTVNTVRGP